MSGQAQKARCQFLFPNDGCNMGRVKISQQNLVLFATPRVNRFLMVFVRHVRFVFFTDYDGRWVHE